ncbi:hypothetical protein B0H11DRAFT_2193489 [Mycena galericulata]|nr:hypothetical protein B0H11DRAFT_2193489 [Mycena galericulata]
MPSSVLVNSLEATSRIMLLALKHDSRLTTGHDTPIRPGVNLLPVPSSFPGDSCSEGPPPARALKSPSKLSPRSDPMVGTGSALCVLYGVALTSGIVPRSTRGRVLSRGKTIFARLSGASSLSTRFKGGRASLTQHDSMNILGSDIHSFCTPPPSSCLLESSDPASSSNLRWEDLFDSGSDRFVKKVIGFSKLELTLPANQTGPKLPLSDRALPVPTDLYVKENRAVRFHLANRGTSADPAREELEGRRKWGGGPSASWLPTVPSTGVAINVRCRDGDGPSKSGRVFICSASETARDGKTTAVSR